MKILFVVEKRNTPNYLCVHKISEACAERGFDVCILSQGYEKEEFCYINEKIKEFSIRPDFTTNIINRTTKTKLEGIGKLLYKFFIFLLTPIWPIRAPLYLKRLTKRVDRIIEEEGIDVVVLAHVSIENLLTAKKRNEKVIYIGYFLDLLVGGMKLSYMREKTWNKRTISIENQAMKSLDYGIMMDSSRQLYEDTRRFSYVNKLIFLDLPMLSETSEKGNERYRGYFPKNHMILLFVGSMANNVRDPHYFLELFTNISNPNARFVIVGRTDYQELIDKYMRKDNRIEYFGRKPYEESLSMMSEADFLINIGNNLQNMVPSKIFEYMSYRKPIISTYKVDNDPCLKPLSKYGLFLAIDERIAVSENINKVENFIDQNMYSQIDEHQFRRLTNKGGALYNNTPRAFADAIETLSGEYKR